MSLILKKSNQIINQLEEYATLKQNNIAELSNDKDELTTMGNFWKKKNTKISAPIKNEFILMNQSYQLLKNMMIPFHGRLQAFFKYFFQISIFFNRCIFFGKNIF